MRRLVLIICLAALVITGQQASAQTETVWTGWGQAKYAESKDAAVLLLPDALVALDVPEPVRALFQQAVKDNPDGNVLTPEGKIPHLNAGDRFKAMMSGPDSKHANAHVMVNVVVGTIPVKGKTGVHEAAEARVWRVEYEGQEYFLVLPTICNNWAWRANPLPVPKEAPPPVCAELYVPVKPGDKLTANILPMGYLPPPSECSAFKQGATADYTQQPCLTCFDVTTDGVWLRYSLEAIKHDISVCIVRVGEDGKPKKSCAIVVEPKDWVDNKFSIKPEWWKWSEECKGTEFPDT